MLTVNGSEFGTMWFATVFVPASKMAFVHRASLKTVYLTVPPAVAVAPVSVDESMTAVPSGTVMVAPDWPAPHRLVEIDGLAGVTTTSSFASLHFPDTGALLASPP